MNLLSLSIILQFFAPYWNSLGLPILEAADLAGKLIPLMEAVIPHIRYVSESGEDVKALTDTKDRLKAARDGIMDDINIAEREGSKRTPEVDNWLKRVEAEAGEVAKMEEACRKRKRVLGVSVNWVSSYKDGQRVRKKAKVVEELRTEASSIVITRRLPPPSVQEMPTIPRMVGIESDKNEVLLHIAYDSTGIIAIRGMGGVGKTTLLKEVNNSFLPGSERSSEFDHVIWTVASKDCTLEKLQKGIAEKLGLSLEAYAQPPNVVLFENLKSKNFLLLLDDLWRGFELEDVGIPHPGTGGIFNQYKRKVVLTTRLQNVCRKMSADVEIKMNCLGQREALDLFKFHVGEQTLNSHPDIIGLAGVVAEECRGLPLALKTIGSAMRNWRDPKQWRHAIELLKDSKHADLREMEILPEEGEERDMFRTLKLSYDNLPDDGTKQCFLSCCLWPEDWQIKKDELIECWMGLGLIDESNGNLSWGHYHIRILEGTCLLEPCADKERVRMHDVIRDLALWIASDCGRKKNKWLVQACVGLMEAIDVKQKWIGAEGVERISLMHNGIEMLPQYLPHRPNLKVLMLQRNYALRRIPPHLFQCIPALTYLDLSKTALEELPEEIGMLVQLQYLNLSWTNIKALPKELACLKELKYLLLRNITGLLRIPRGGISNLSKLRQLDLFETELEVWEVEGSRGCGSEENRASLEELEELNSKVMSLTNLGITVNGVRTIQKLSRLDNIVTRYLHIRSTCSSASIQLTPSIVKAQIGSLKMLKSLQKLKIQFSCLVELEVDGEDQDHDMDWQLPDLEELHLSLFFKLKVVTWARVSISDFLPQLRSVAIYYCPKLENANWVLLLPQLESLNIVCCPKMRQVIDDSVGSHVGYNSALAFHCLRILLLEDLDSLTSICDQAISFPSLEIIEIENCDKLKQLPVKIMGSNLREIWGSEGWWQSLQCQDENVKASLLPYFRMIKYRY